MGSMHINHIIIQISKNVPVTVCSEAEYRALVCEEWYLKLTRSNWTMRGLKDLSRWRRQYLQNSMAGGVW